MPKRFLGVFASVGALCLTSLLLSRSAAPQQITASAFIASPMTIRVTADRMITSSTLAAIMDLSWTLPSLPAAQAYSFHCAGSYKQGSPAADQFGLQVGTGTVAANNWEATGVVQIGSAFTGGVAETQTTTSPTKVVGSTPSTGTVDLTWEMDGTVANKASQSMTVSIMYLAGGSTHSTTIYRGSFCAITP